MNSNPENTKISYIFYSSLFLFQAFSGSLPSLMFMCIVVDFGEVESINKIFRMNKGQEMVPLTQAKNDSVFKKKFLINRYFSLKKKKWLLSVQQ